jgi:hypothetical protein
MEGKRVTVRVYLAAARLLDGPLQPGDLPAERLFVHASDLPELWVETESLMVPPPGKSVGFFLSSNIDIGVRRITGTVERVVSTQTRERVQSS